MRRHEVLEKSGFHTPGIAIGDALLQPLQERGVMEITVRH